MQLDAAKSSDRQFILITPQVGYLDIVVSVQTNWIWPQDMANVQLAPEVRVHRMNDPGMYYLVPPIHGEAQWFLTFVERGQQALQF